MDMTKYEHKIVIAGNGIMKTDSYKIAHWWMTLPGLTNQSGYFEFRKGGKWKVSIFAGLQYTALRHLVGEFYSAKDLAYARPRLRSHFGGKDLLNHEMIQYIIDEYQGRLPIRIRAIPEGTKVPVGNVLMQVEVTDPKCAAVEQMLEGLLQHVWYMSNVATLSYEVEKLNEKFLRLTGCGLDMLSYMLQDFGFRGASCWEAAMTGGMAHLFVHRGSDTLCALEGLETYYGAEFTEGQPWDTGFSVPATEHAVMTEVDDEHEVDLIRELMHKFATGVLSLVADTRNVKRFVEVIIGETLHDEVQNRDGVIVIRPDSITPDLPTPAIQMVWILETLAMKFGYTLTSTGHMLLPSCVRVLWGDGIGLEDVEEILQAIADAGFAAGNIACFGMGGGLLQKHNRDTQRAAFKASAFERDGKWHDMQKTPLDESKKSKSGRLKLVLTTEGVYKTVGIDDEGEDQLETVFENGKLVKFQTLDDIRARIHA